LSVVYVDYQNPDATMPMQVPVLILPNTPEEVGNAQIAANAALDLPWFQCSPAHDRAAVICGGGPSLKDHAEAIKAHGGTVFGLNGAASWLVGQGIKTHYQVIVDPKQETSRLVEPYALRHLCASQVHPDTLVGIRPTLFHMNFEGVEDLLPPKRVAQGGYTLIGGGVSVGITALVLAYAMGYR
jgi:hypothetical protein